MIVADCRCHPDEILSRPVMEFLAPADTTVFAEATQKLLEDDNNTVQLRVRFEVHLQATEEITRPVGGGAIFVELEGVGMLMREDHEPSHTMWVLRPVTATRVDNIDEIFFPHGSLSSSDVVLCRICEREIVTWFFRET